MGSGVVKLHLNKLVTDYDFEGSRFFVKERLSGTNGANGHANGATGETGEWLEADVILAADGVKSKARAAMLRRKGEVDTGEP